MSEVFLCSTEGFTSFTAKKDGVGEKQGSEIIETKPSNCMHKGRGLRFFVFFIVCVWLYANSMFYRTKACDFLA